MDIKDRIKYLRESKGWTLSFLAQKAEVSHSTISHIEVGRNKPTAEVIKKLAGAFEVSTDYLLGTEERATTVLKIKDKELLEQFRRVDQLPGEEREIIKFFLNFLLSKKSTKKSSSWSKQRN